MPYKVQYSTLNASTADIMNVIRANASINYQANVPEVTQSRDILRVGQCILGEASLTNEFVNALVNRIALVRVRSAIFYNPFRDLKKGVLTLGETVEEAYIGLARAMAFSATKAEKREFKRYLPDVKTAFHPINYKVLYPLSIERPALEKAFLSENGVTDFIMRLMDSIFTGASYDEYLLFKYLIIKNFSKTAMYTISLSTESDLKAYAAEFRGMSNVLTFVSDKYNARRVQTATPRENQHIFMDAKFNAQFDVEVLASAFNMDKADFMGRLHLVDSFSTFDNDRFAVIREESDGLEEVTANELDVMKHVKAVIVDDEWFQIYDTLENGGIMTEQEVASGLRWNYFYHVWKTVSVSPFSNAVVFMEADSSADSEEYANNLNTIAAKVTAKDESNEVYTLTLAANRAIVPVNIDSVQFSVADSVKDKVACHKYGALIVPKYSIVEGAEPVTEIPMLLTLYGVQFSATIDITTVKTGDTVTFNKVTT